MALRREDKVALVNQLKDRMSRAKVMVLSEYRGLNVAVMTSLRRKIRESGGQMQVSKNTLARIAAREVGIEGLDDKLRGPIAITYGYDDPVTVVKTITQFQKDYAKTAPFEIIGGVIEGKYIDSSGIKRVADLPPREVLVAQVIGAMQAPIAGLVNVLQGNIRNFVYVLEAVRKQKAGEA
ncbi:MAG: 50S ribosomal protein L10 [Bacillota bacterium]